MKFIPYILILLLACGVHAASVNGTGRVFTGDGSGLTNLTSTNISGIIPTNNLPQNASYLTNLPAGYTDAQAQAATGVTNKNGGALTNIPAAGVTGLTTQWPVASITNLPAYQPSTTILSNLTVAPLTNASLFQPATTILSNITVAPLTNASVFVTNTAAGIAAAGGLTNPVTAFQPANVNLTNLSSGFTTNLNILGSNYVTGLVVGTNQMSNSYNLMFMSDNGNALIMRPDLGGGSGAIGDLTGNMFFYFNAFSSHFGQPMNIYSESTIKINPQSGSQPSVQFYTNGILITTNSFCPTPVGNGGWLWVSNKALYWVTTSKTNLLSSGL